MTNADEEYLKRFLKAKRDEEVAKEKETILANKDPRRQGITGGLPPGEEEDDLVAVTDFNPRLIIERNKAQKNLKDQDGNDISLTDAIFLEKAYYRTKEDTADDDQMDKYVKGDWQSSAFVKKPKKRLDIPPRGPAGNIVPFFPAEWSKNSNYMFNSEIFMDKHYPDELDEYNEVKHAAIYRIQNTVAPGLSKKV